MNKKLIEEYRLRYPNVDPDKLEVAMFNAGFESFKDEAPKSGVSLSSANQEKNNEMKDKLHIILKGEPLFRKVKLKPQGRITRLNN